MTSVFYLGYRFPFFILYAVDTLSKNRLSVIGFSKLVVKFRFGGEMPSHQLTGHCEPVTDVTGVAIS